MRATIALLVLMLLAAGAHAEKRVALVVGNSAYQHSGTLTNPTNDATDVAAALKKLGFQVLDAFNNAARPVRCRYGTPVRVYFAASSKTQQMR